MAAGAMHAVDITVSSRGSQLDENGCANKIAFTHRCWKPPFIVQEVIYSRTEDHGGECFVPAHTSSYFSLQFIKGLIEFLYA